MAILSSHDLNICCTNMNCRYFKNSGDKNRHYKTTKICQTVWGAARAVRKCLWGLWAEWDLLGTSRRWRTPQSHATASPGTPSSCGQPRCLHSQRVERSGLPQSIDPCLGAVQHGHATAPETPSRNNLTRVFGYLRKAEWFRQENEKVWTI